MLGWKQLPEQFYLKQKLLHNKETTAIRKSFMLNYKKHKIFFCMPVSKFQEILTSNICDGVCIEQQQTLLKMDLIIDDIVSWKLA